MPETKSWLPSISIGSGRFAIKDVLLLQDVYIQETVRNNVQEYKKDEHTTRDNHTDNGERTKTICFRHKTSVVYDF